jgi:hypothetical protein
MLKKFENSDIFINRIKTYPKTRILTHSGSMYYNNSNNSTESGVSVYDFLMVPPPPPEPPRLTESFEDWPGTISDPKYYQDFQFDSVGTNSIQDSLEISDGWT